MPAFSILRPSKIYPNRDFCFENKPSGNPAFKTTIRVSTFCCPTLMTSAKNRNNRRTVWLTEASEVVKAGKSEAEIFVSKARKT
jgi:hypothetical protein